VGERTFRDRNEATTWQEEQEPFAPKVGEPAPDFTLSDIHGSRQVTLSEFRGERPVALVFGSFT